ncbi:nitrilase-related carbon-nitrogen hydrolase [Achromobacter marplatensis]|uniref:nitrilase-related carbon-nitrogen hydrolase n=1 Tax=Achromobacter marplatensis TaxID=470868 RepID=UPI0028EC7576|nr:nitrilase-related carbon-nitrogen hydrolase [Achromobacter marplatensis]
MARHITIGAAQLGPIAKGEGREAVVKRLIALLRQASARGCELVVFPELALTTFFPRWLIERGPELDAWYEAEMPNTQTQPLFDEARALGIGFYIGYAELAVEDGKTHHYNTSILVGADGEIIGKYRKIHLPGHVEPQPGRDSQHLEKRYFEPGNLGFPVWDAFGGVVGMCLCNDRRWPETYRVMALQGAELVVLGYNTPNDHTGDGAVDGLSNFHNHLAMQAGAYQNSTWVVGTAKCGREEGSLMIGQSAIIAPSGEIVAMATTLEDELVTARCDLDMSKVYRETFFDFARHREPQHYGLIVERKGVGPALTKSVATRAHAPLDACVKGMPGLIGAVPLEDIAKQGWNVLREDLPLPLAVIRQDALHHNSDWMRRFLEERGSVFAPHGKTTMSPQLFDLQRRDGAWGITLATCHQVQVARQFGAKRVVLANQLVGKQSVAYILQALRDDPSFDFYCLVDDAAHVEALAQAARVANIGRPLQVLLEVGYAGGRTGCRDDACVQAVIAALKQASPYLALRGVEGFEGLIKPLPDQDVETQIAVFLARMIATVQACEAQQVFADGPILLSAGGSSFYDLVTRHFSPLHLSREHMVLTRSGCYLTHDSHLYKEAFARLKDRSPDVASLGHGLRPALEVWGYVQSRPESGKVIVNLGKRDISPDHMPPVMGWFRPGTDTVPAAGAAPSSLSPGHVATGLDDQHCHMSVPVDSPLRVGDMVCFGISHPCLTFDKWEAILMVDERYDVVGAIRTYF